MPTMSRALSKIADTQQYARTAYRRGLRCPSSYLSPRLTSSLTHPSSLLCLSPPLRVSRDRPFGTTDRAEVGQHRMRVCGSSYRYRDGPAHERTCPEFSRECIYTHVSLTVIAGIGRGARLAHQNLIENLSGCEAMLRATLTVIGVRPRLAAACWQQSAGTSGRG